MAFEPMKRSKSLCIINLENYLSQNSPTDSGDEAKYWTLDEKLMCEFVDIWGSKLPEIFDDNAVLLQSAFVWEEFRRQGLFQTLLDKTKKIADSTGCCVIAVSNPFSILDPEWAKRFGFDLGSIELGTRTEAFVKGKSFEFLKNHRSKQDWMNGRLRKNGFKNIDVREAIGDRSRCPPNCCHIYIPSTASADFMREIRKRTF